MCRRPVTSLLPTVIRGADFAVGQAEDCSSPIRGPSPCARPATTLARVARHLHCVLCSASSCWRAAAGRDCDRLVHHRLFRASASCAPSCSTRVPAADARSRRLRGSQPLPHPPLPVGTSSGRPPSAPVTQSLAQGYGLRAPTGSARCSMPGANAPCRRGADSQDPYACIQCLARSRTRNRSAPQPMPLTRSCRAPRTRSSAASRGTSRSPGCGRARRAIPCARRCSLRRPRRRRRNACRR